MRVPTRLLPYDLYERHTVTTRLLRERLPGVGTAAAPRLLDVGGRAELLQRFLGQPVLSVNVDRSGDLLADGLALPFADGAFDGVVTLDTLEHLPPDVRLPFLKEALRLARRVLLVAAPFGTEAHMAAEQRLDALYEQARGEPHPYLSEHVRYGLPTLTDLEQWADVVGCRRVEQYFAGDYQWQAELFEAALRHPSSGGAVARLQMLRHRIVQTALFHPIDLQPEPNLRSNRFYLVFQKDGS